MTLQIHFPIVNDWNAEHIEAFSTIPINFWKKELSIKRENFNMLKKG